MELHQVGRWCPERVEQPAFIARIMIVSNEDISAFKAELLRYERDTRWQIALHQAIQEFGAGAPEGIAQRMVDQMEPSDWDGVHSDTTPNDILGYFRKNPQLLIPSGFDEVRIQPKPAADLYCALDQEYSKHFANSRIADSPVFQKALPSFEVLLGLECRQASSGLWFHSSGFEFVDQELLLRSGRQSAPLRLSLRGILAACERCMVGDTHPAAILLPNLWLPPESCPALELVDTTKAILGALKREKVEFTNLSWQQLEDVVAELLRARGMRVQLTSRRKDGGRDIIARGELIPGEPTTLAVEVKHRPKVQLDDVRSRLWANREFPMLMFATSGRFTAGVIREKQKPENFLRLLLKDGQALRAWIQEYGLD